MSQSTPFATLLASRTRLPDGQHVEYHVPADWGQGRTTYGGFISALTVQAMKDVAGGAWAPDVRLRALQTSFIGPVVPGPARVRVQVLREGKSIRHVQATVLQGDATAALLLGVFGVERDTVVPVLSPAQPAVARSVDASMQVPFMPGLSPNFLQHLDIRWSEGVPPFSGKESWHSRLFMRLDAPGVDPDVLTVLLADVPPTPVISNFKQPAPASSVSWELELRPLAAPVDPAAYWRIDTDVIAAAGSYANQVSKLWSPSGELASIGYQVVAVYG